MKINKEFCNRIERIEAQAWRGALEHGKRTFPHHGVEVTEIGGATVCFGGVTSFFSRALGLGVGRTVSVADVDAVANFYRSRGTAARIMTTPLVDSSTFDALIARGFAVEEHENALAGDLNEIHGARDARVTMVESAELWAQRSARAFSDGRDPDDALLFDAVLMASHPQVRTLALNLKDDVVATACFAVETDEVAALFATSTAPAARGRGYQRALIGDRIARAREAGATIARATAKPASASERNFRRFGFEVLYSRTTWIDVRGVRPAAAPSNV